MTKDEELIERIDRMLLASPVDEYTTMIAVEPDDLREIRNRLETLARPVVGVEGLDRLRPYLRHQVACQTRLRLGHKDCSCGLADLLSPAALAASPSPVVGDREAIGRAYRNCAEMNRQMAGTIGAQPGSSIFAALEACAERMDEIATDNADPHTTDRAGMAQEVE